MNSQPSKMWLKWPSSLPLSQPMRSPANPSSSVMAGLWNKASSSAGGKLGQIAKEVALVGNPGSRNLKTALINLNPAKRFVKSGGLIVARHGQDNEIAP